MEEKNLKLFADHHIFTEGEAHSRYEINLDNYSKVINIEALTMLDMANKQIIPAVVKFAKTLVDTTVTVKMAGGDATVSKALLKEVTAKLTAMKKAAEFPSF